MEKEPEKIKDYKKLNLIKDTFKMLENYKNLDLSTNNSSRVISKRFYEESFIMYAVLESFLLKNEMSFKQLNQNIIHYIPKDFVEEVSVNYINRTISKMIRLNLITPIETDNKYNPIFKITEDGFELYQKQSLKENATNTFYSYQAQDLNIKVSELNKKMLNITYIILIATLITIVISIIK